MSQDIRSIIAKNVKKYREIIGYKREQLSLLIDKDLSYISKLERTNINATIDTLEKIADTLEVPIIKLFERK